MSYIFLTPEPGLYRAPRDVLPAGWLWAYAPEPLDDVYFVNEATGSSQWPWPGLDEAGREGFFFWLSEKLKVDEYGQALGVSRHSVSDDAGPADRALHGFGKAQARPSTSGMTFKQKMANFFVGDIQYRPPPGTPQAGSNKGWKWWKKQTGFKPPAQFNTYFETQQSQPFTPGPSMSSHQQQPSEPWATQWGLAGRTEPPKVEPIQPAPIPDTNPNPAYLGQQGPSMSSQRPNSVASSFDSNIYQPTQSTQSFSTTSSPLGQYIQTPASSSQDLHQLAQGAQGHQQATLFPPMAAGPHMSPQILTPPSTSPPGPAPAIANHYQPVQNGHYVPGVIKASAFRPRPRELGDDSAGPGGPYVQQPFGPLPVQQPPGPGGPMSYIQQPPNLGEAASYYYPPPPPPGQAYGQPQW